MANDQNIAELHAPLSPRDADVFRRWIKSRNVSGGSSPTSIAYFLDDGDPPAGECLVHRLNGLPFENDIHSWKLSARDFISADASDTEWVKSRLVGIGGKREARIVCDFSSRIERFEARDGQLRAGQTDFGQFIAECVRRRAGADISILNSGMFRCDCELPSKLRERDLHEAFLYDNDNAIVVVDLTCSEVDALIAHGRAHVGKGAFPQISDARKGSPAKARVAISSYVLGDGSAIDGYDQILAALRGILADRLHEEVKGLFGTDACFSVVSAVLQEGETVAYRSGAALRSAESEAGLFVRLAKALWVSLRTSAPRRKHIAYSQVRDVMRAKHLGPDLQRDRNALRHFLQNYARANLVGDPKAMLRLRSEIEGHVAVFADGIHYHKIFDFAAECVPGWRS